MKRYWPLFGAVGIASTIGLYGYVSRDPLYEEPETEEEFFEEEIEYGAELPEEEIPVPKYTTKKIEKEKIQTKRKQKHPDKDNKETKPKNMTYYPSLPKSSLEEALEEENEERPWYDLPAEKREALTSNWTLENLGDKSEELGNHYREALKAYDFKVAASYIADLSYIVNLSSIAEPEKYVHPESYDRIRADLAYHIATVYDDYLSEVIANCNGHSFDSVFRKVMWMNLFLAEHQEIFASDYIREFNLETFVEKGNGALDSIKYCK